MDRAGMRILYHDRKGYENEWRKHHKSSIARDIWLYDMKSKKHTKLTSFEGEDRNPVWSPDETEVYYLSEKSLGASGVLAAGPIIQLRDQYLAGRKVNYQKLWQVLMFQLWYDRWMQKL